MTERQEEKKLKIKLVKSHIFFETAKFWIGATLSFIFLVIGFIISLSNYFNPNSKIDLQSVLWAFGISVMLLASTKIKSYKDLIDLK